MDTPPRLTLVRGTLGRSGAARTAAARERARRDATAPGAERAPEPAARGISEEAKAAWRRILLRALNAPALVAFALAASSLLACAPLRTRSDAAAARSGTSERGLHWVETGSGEPLVLIHAFHMDHREWDEVVEALGPGYRVIRYDLRGHGGSAPAAERFSAHEELAALLRELGVERAHVAGLSAGATVALDLAIERPDLVRSVALVSPGVPEIPVQVSRAWMRPIGEAVRGGRPDSAAALWWESQVMAGTRARGAAGARYRDVVLANARIWTQNPAAQQRPVPAPGTRLATLRAPLLVVVGELDAMGARAQADSMRARVPAARVVTVAGAGHMLSTERPAELARLLRDFARAAAER